MDDDPKTRRDVQGVSRWVCIILWTFVMAPLIALLLAFPISWILFFVFTDYMFNVGPPDWVVALYYLLWIAGAFLLGCRGRLPGTAIPTTTHCANCGYDLTANTTGICPECGAAITPRATT